MRIAHNQAIKLSIAVIIALIMSCFVPAYAQGVGPFSQGNWLKVAVTKSGVYKISYETLRKEGFSDPKKVYVFGYGGGQLPEALQQCPAEALPSVPVLHTEDALYFYGEGVTRILQQASTPVFYHQTNCYSTKGYYFLSDAKAGSELSTHASPQTGAVTTTRTYDDYFLHEVERYSLKQSGRMLFGEALSNGAAQRISLPLANNLAADGEHILSVAYSALPQSKGELTVKSGSTTLLQDPISRSEDYSSAAYLKGIYHLRTATYRGDVSGPLNLDVSYLPRTETAYLDYISLQSTSRLIYSAGTQMHIRKHMTNVDAHTYRFQFDKMPANMQVWAVASPNDVYRLPVESNSFTADIISPSALPMLFIAFQLSDAYPLEVVGKVRSDFSARAYSERPSLIIITPQHLLKEAQRLATFHHDALGQNVLVVPQEVVFNEFSSGTPDATAYRLLAKYFFDKYEKIGNSNDIPHLHLLLFGDGAVDNRLLSKEWAPLRQQGVELLLTYESENSLNINSYTSDDYFAALLESEDNLHLGARTQCIGVGRFPIRTLQEAENAVDKTIRYASNKDLGEWKTKTAIVADDGNGFGHLKRGEGLAQAIESHIPELEVSKIYLEAFPKETVNGLTTFPGAKRKLLDAFEKGLVLVNYTGHGNPNSWADEQIITTADIRSFRYTHLPFWITATCDFANYDSPTTSAGEAAFLNASSGAVALLTTTRVVYDIYNQQLNVAFLNSILTRNKEGHVPTFGAAVAQAKNAIKGSWDNSALINKLNFVLLGDPAIAFNLPTHRAVVESINNTAVSGSEGIPMKALQRVQVKGSIRSYDNESVDGNFTGMMGITVFDSETTMSTLAANSDDDEKKVATYKDYPGLLYAGNCAVKEGYFEFSFIVPKDLTYKEGRSRINLYAYSKEGNRVVEAMGVNTSTYITSGTAEETADTIPPTIRKCFLNDSTRVDHFVTGPTPIFYAEIYDASGINLTSGGIGHQITLTIDNREDYTYQLNDYYKASALEPGLGTVVYLLPPIDEGDHVATFTVWDVVGNCSSKTLHFRVNKDLRPSAAVSVVYPNPVVAGEPLTLQITSENAGEELQAEVEIYDLAGRIICKSPRFVVHSTALSPATITWTPQSSYGTYPSSGFYMYRCTLQNKEGKQVASAGKLVIVEHKNSGSQP